MNDGSSEHPAEVAQAAHREVVDADDLDALGEQALDEVRSDEAGGSGDADASREVHAALLCRGAWDWARLVLGGDFLRDAISDAEDGLAVDDVGVHVRRGRHGEPGRGEQVGAAVVVAVAVQRLCHAGPRHLRRDHVRLGVEVGEHRGARGRGRRA